MIPTKEERKLAAKVLRSYEKKAKKLAAKTAQERPREWARGLAQWIELLKLDPDKELDDYESEYDAGH